MKNKFLFTKAAQEVTLEAIAQDIISNKKGLRACLTKKACDLIKEIFGGEDEGVPYKVGDELKGLYLNPNITDDQVKDFFRSLNYIE